MERDARREREIQRRREGGRRRRKRRRNPRAIPVLIAVVLILIVGGGMAGKMLYEKYSPSKEMADAMEYFNLTNEQEMAVIFDGVLLEDKARFVDGKVYLNVETVYQHLNPRFYWDAKENLYLYALPTELVTVEVGSSEYTVAKSKTSEDYVILRADGSDAYVALDFVANYTNFIYQFWEDPNHVQITTKFGSRDIAAAQKKSAVRYKPGIKSPVLTYAEKGSKLLIVPEEQEIEEWTRVLTEDGYIGWIRDKKISAVTQETVAAPEFEEPEYTSLSKDYKASGDQYGCQ